MPHSTLTGRLGRAVRTYGRDSVEVAAVRKLLSEQRAKEKIDEIAALDPPLTPTDIVDLASLLFRKTLDRCREETTRGGAG